MIISAHDPGAVSDPQAKKVARGADGWWLNDGWPSLIWPPPVLGIGGALIASRLVILRYTPSAFVASSRVLFEVIGTAGAGMFPCIRASSTLPNSSLALWESVSSPMTLPPRQTLGATRVFLPMIVF